MTNTLRAKLIKAAKDHPERRADLLPLIRLAGSTDSWEELERKQQRLMSDIQRMVGSRGKAIAADWGGGGAWSVVFDTEHAALYAYWMYSRGGGNTSTHMTPPKGGLKGWSFSIRK